MTRNANATATVATATAAAAVTTDSWTFTPTTITLLGRTLPATYSVAKDGTVYVRTGADGTPIRLSLRSGDPRYHAAFEAAGLAKQAATKPAKPAAAKPAKPAATKPAKPAAAKPAKPAAKSEALFRFVRDEAIQRLRLEVLGDATPAQRDAIAAAGFYWSNVTKSYHKRLTPKAMRAAAALTDTLMALTK